MRGEMEGVARSQVMDLSCTTQFHVIVSIRSAVG
jgi:hypothetical protein